MGRSFGLIPEPPNPKHWSTERLYGTTFTNFAQEHLTADEYAGPEVSADLRSFSPVRHDQGSIGSCVANAVCKAIEITTQIERGNYTDLSRMAVYYLARELMVPPHVMEDSGTFISSAFDAVRRFGVPPEQDWPYNVQKVYTSPNWGVMRKAHQHRLSGFYRLETTGEDLAGEIRYHLTRNRPVVFGTGVDTAHMHYQAGQTLQPPQKQNIVGYHAMTLVGWDSGRWIIENSWGADWGEDGFARASADYILGETALDYWVVTLPYQED